VNPIIIKKYTNKILIDRKSTIVVLANNIFKMAKYDCMLGIKVPDEFSKKIINIGNQIDKNILDEEDGLEKDIHISLIYGVNDIKNKVGDLIKKPIKIKTDSKISYFDNKDRNQSVAKIKVISKDLEKLHYFIRENFDNKQTFDEYNPHITIAYLKYGERLPKSIQIESMEWESNNMYFSD